MPEWEELEGARQDLLCSFRARVRAWMEQELPVLMQRFQTAAAAGLEAAAGRRYPWDDPDTFADYLRARILHTLATTQTEVMRALQSGIQALARGFGREAGPALGARLGLSPGGPSSSDELRSCLIAALVAEDTGWVPPLFPQLGAPVWALDLRPNAMRLFLPGPWVRRHLLALAREGIPAAISSASAQMEKLSRDYWESCLDSLDEAIGLKLQQLQSALGQGTHPVGPWAQPAEDPGGSGCVVCTKAWSALYDFFRQLQHELTIDAGVQSRFRVGNGLCPSHLWLLERFSSPRGLGVGMPVLVEDFARSLADLVDGESEGEVWARIPHLADAGACPACLTLARVVREVVEHLGSHLEDPLASGGDDPMADLCLQHLPLVLVRVDPCRGVELARRLALRLDRVAAAMAGYNLKFDARRMDLLSDAERHAHREAIAWLAGDRMLADPR